MENEQRPVMSKDERMASGLIKRAMYTAYKRGFNNGNQVQDYNDFFVREQSDKTASMIMKNLFESAKG